MASASQRSRELNTILARQRRGLTNPTTQRTVFDEIVRRHTPAVRKVPQERTLLELATVQYRDHDWLVSKDDIVVPAAEADRARRALRQAGFVHRVDGRLVSVFSRVAPGTTSVEDTVRQLRQRGLHAGPNMVHATGQVRMKGGSAPAVAPTRNALGKRPASRDGQGVKVAVVDTGIWDEADRRGDGWLDGIAISADNCDPLDAFSPTGPGSNGLLDWGAGHGTFVAGVIRKRAPAADVVLYRALDSAGVGSDADVAETLLKAADDGADIIHCSFGGPGFDDLPPVALTEAMRVVDPRVLIVAAAGNDANSTPVYPAAFKRVVAVASLDKAGKPSEFSSRGWWVDVSTEGEGVVSTFVDGTEEPIGRRKPSSWTGRRPIALWSGTSFAAPTVTGAVAAELAKMRGRPATKNATARQAFESLVAGKPQITDFGIVL
jgi:subtilisin family serine protease